ncbi:amidohydrolase family protein [Proteocatella sphenisci]|uniref:amidohydrolase family protein n=1 Tax=Proteocatella sphenisci TaxID=181070 RepID=UPI00048F3B02|nr:amidohydrolase family protein [Proteocatella sphenisci]
MDKGYIDIEGNRITDVVLGEKPEGDYIDMSGKYVLPGLINIHSLDFVKEISSKYIKFFTEEKAFYQVEKLLAESGITTVFHTFTLDKFSEDRDLEEVIEKLTYVKSYRKRKFLIDHKVHLKFKLGDVNLNKRLKALFDAECVDFVTCTGYNSDIIEEYQEQYYSQYLQDRFEIDEELAGRISERLKELREESALDELSYKIKFAKSRKIPFAVSKCELVEKLRETYKIGIDLLVDPRNPKSMEYISCNNLSASIDVECLVAENSSIDFVDEMAEDNINILSASKRSRDILEYVFNLEGNIGLPKAVRLASYNPAMALGMYEKGEIAPGKEADIIVVDIFEDLPINIMTISDGKIIVKYNYN